MHLVTNENVIGHIYYCTRSLSLVVLLCWVFNVGVDVMECRGGTLFTQFLMCSSIVHKVQ